MTHPPNDDHDDDYDWVSHAQQVLAQNGHHSGQARRALLGLLASQACALSPIEN